MCIFISLASILKGFVGCHLNVYIHFLTLYPAFVLRVRTIQVESCIRLYASFGQSCIMYDIGLKNISVILGKCMSWIDQSYAMT